MDYVVGSVAALISGNLTPSRQRIVKRALTPVKRQPSPNVTPKSEFVDDRSIFLSPTMQRKKALIKKSPKRIFENPDLNVTHENESSSVTSPKVDKAKKHLKNQLDTEEEELNNSSKSGGIQESTLPKKKSMKKQYEDSLIELPDKSPKTKKNKNKTNDPVTESKDEQDTKISPKKKRKLQNQDCEENPLENNTTLTNNDLEVPQELNNNNKKNKNKKSKLKITKLDTNEQENIEIHKVKKKKSKKHVNPNAVTTKDTDSEHESDNEIESENEKTNEEVLKTEEAQSSSEDEAEQAKPKQKDKTEFLERDIQEELARTIFVGNVIFNKKCKKEIKKIFLKHGPIESVRIRTIPVKDAHTTPKLAIIKNELHPERSTVNVYVKFKELSSVEPALSENNTVLNGSHLRVSRSDSAGAEHDPRRSVFVGNLPFALEDEALRSQFINCGEIESVRIVRDRKTNAGKGFGYVNFASKDSVELALEMSEEDLTIKNRILRVKRCTQMTQKQQDRQNKTNKQNFNDRNQNHNLNKSQGRAFQSRNISKDFGNTSREFGNKFQDKQFQQRDKSRNFGNDRFQNKSFQRDNSKGRFGNKFQGKNFQGQDSPGNNSKGRFGNKFQGKNFQGQGSQGRFGINQNGEQQEGAYRRIKNKRQIQESGDGPPNKRPRDDQVKEKKAKKEFVGMTAEKKKKHKPNKGLKKKKELSEILTK